MSDTPRTDSIRKRFAGKKVSSTECAELYDLASELELDLAEAAKQRDAWKLQAVHFKARTIKYANYHLDAIRAEDALKKMTAKRDALAEELGKMLSAFNIMESSEERDVWESAHSIWLAMKGGVR